MSWLLDFSWVKERHVDLTPRGSHKPSPVASSIFIGLRSLDPLLQYGILTNGVGSSLLARAGLETLVPAPSLDTGIRLIDALNLSPSRLVLLAMALGSSVKQIHWRAFISREEMSIGQALEVSIFNCVSNSINTLAFTAAALSSSAGRETFPQPAMIAGTSLYVVGLALEWIAELQRDKFKGDPGNAGKPYTSGLWRYARHINYGGYILWRAGFAMAGAGWGYGAFVGLFFLWDFTTRGVPVMDKYCSKRYGDDWQSFKRQTPHILIPFLW